MTQPLFRDDAYLTRADCTVTAINDRGGIEVDASIFYPTGGGQAGDCGTLAWDDGTCRIATTVKGEGDAIVLVPDADETPPPIGTTANQTLDWEVRHRLMRLHTALHLMSVVIPLPVTGGQITAQKGRLDFDMPHAPEDKSAIETAINDLIAADHPVSDFQIAESDLRANPALVKTVSVMPPSGAGQVRLVRIGPEHAPVDLQACGGTHVRSTGEIGAVRLGKVEKKSRTNRRFNLFLDDRLPGCP